MWRLECVLAWAGEAAGHQTADWRLAHLSTPGRHQALALALAPALDSSMDTVDTDTGDTVATSRPGQVAERAESPAQSRLQLISAATWLCLLSLSLRVNTNVNQG